MDREGDWEWPMPPTPCVDNAQLVAECLEHFAGDPASSRSEEGYIAQSTGGGTASVNTSIIRPNSDGNALLRLSLDVLGAQAGATFRQQNRFLLANDLSGVWSHVARSFMSQIPDATHLGRVFHGLCDNPVNQVEPADGTYFFLDETPGSNWLIKQARAGARSSVDTGFAPVAGAWQSWKWVMDVAAGTVQAFAANDGDVWAPVGGLLTPADIQFDDLTMSQAAASSEGIRNDLMDFNFDYIGWRHQYAAPR